MTSKRRLALRPTNPVNYVVMLGATLSLGVMGWQRPTDAQIAFFRDTPKELIDEVWQIVDQDYVDSTFNEQDWVEVRQEFLTQTYPSTEMAYEAIREMLGLLDDSRTRFMTPTEFRQIQIDSAAGEAAIGLVLMQDEETQELIIDNLVEDSPAFSSDILPGDVLVNIDGVSTDGMTSHDAVTQLRGEVDTSVEVIVQREQQLKTVVLQRAMMEIQPVHYSVETTDQGRIGYIRLTQISANASSEMHEAIQTLELEDVSGYVLDLRNNTGGLFYGTTDIARLWINEGDIVSLQQRDGTETISANGRALSTDKPLAVLVNSDTASGGEILASALQDQQRGALVGTSTLGDTSIQSVHSLGDGSGLAVTIAKWYPPSGRDIDGLGLQPDRLVELSETEWHQLYRSKQLGTTADQQFIAAVDGLLP